MNPVFSKEVDMATKSILPRKREDVPSEIVSKGESDLMRFRDEMDRLFDDFFADPFGIIPFRRKESVFVPKVDVVESDKEIKVSAEIPGMEEKDIQVQLNGDILTISGEKSSEHEEKTEQYHRLERSFGSFQRSVKLPADVDANKVDAIFAKGVLTVTLPKPAEAISKVKKIEVKRAEK